MYSPNGYYQQPPHNGGYAAYSVTPQPPVSAGGYSANGGGSGHHSGSSTPTGGIGLQHQAPSQQQQQQQHQQQQQFMFNSAPTPYGNQMQQMPHHPASNSAASGPYFGLNHNGPHLSSPSYASTPQYSAQLPLAGRHRVTTTLWEDEGTLCFQVDARGVCVARRHDNNMINGTKLLNVCGMSRGKRDGILKNEKERVVVKVGAMHLKGVWITFARGKQLAETNSIADSLYPLFETNIQSFLYHPDNYPRTAAVMAAAQERHAQRQRAPGINSSGAPPSTGAASALPPPPLLRANTTPNGVAPTRGNEEDGGLPAPHSATWGHPPTSTTQHHNANAYNGNSPTQIYQQHPQHNGIHQPQQQQQSSSSGAPGYPLRPAPVDRRHSMPLTLANVHNHPGHAENPYGPPQPSPGAVPRRTSSGLKRSYDEHAESDNIAPPAPGMSYSGSNGGAGMSSSNSSGSVNYEGESPRVYKRARDSRGSGDDNGAGDYTSEADATRRTLGSLSSSSGSMRSPAAANWTPVSTPSLAQSSSGSYSSASGGSGDDDGTRGAYTGGSGLDAYSLASMSTGDNKHGVAQAVAQYGRTDSM